jgi:hypothetical protein
MTDLGPSGIGHIYACINDRGFVVWSYSTVSGQTRFRTWSDEVGVQELDFSVAVSARPCGLDETNRFLISARPTGLSVLGQTIRRRHEVYLWDPNEGVVRLEDRLPVTDAEYFQTTDMNEAGAVAGVLRTKGTNQLRAILLEPIAE